MKELEPSLIFSYVTRAGKMSYNEHIFKKLVIRQKMTELHLFEVNFEKS